MFRHADVVRLRLVCILYTDAVNKAVKRHERYVAL